MNARRLAKRALARLGLRVFHDYDPDIDHQRRLLMATRTITTVLDVGANEGQYATVIRTESAYQGRILSFEPGAVAFAQLSANAHADPLWDVANYGLSDREGTAALNVPRGATTLASLAQMSARGEAWSAPFTSAVDTEQIGLRRLDDVTGEFGELGDSWLLKLDVQGHEDSVLRGAERALEHVAIVECEAALTPMYEDQIKLSDLLMLLTDYGFRAVGVYTHFIDSGSGEAFDADVLLVRD